MTRAATTQQVWGGFILLFLMGCAGDAKPRSVEEISAERDRLPGLFMTESGKRVEAEKSRGVFVDESSGELAWPVYECTNPACPGRSGDQSHLFIWPDPRFHVQSDGTLGTKTFETAQQWREAVEAARGHRQPTCQKCLETRNPAGETPEESQRYAEYPRRYVLPETAQRMLELDEEHQQRIDYINGRISGQ